MRRMNRGGLILLTLCLPVGSQGCAVVTARWHAFWQDRAESALLVQQMKIDETAAIQEQLAAQRRALLAEHELVLAQLEYEADKQECEARSQLDESVRTSLGLDFDQRFQLGQLQVNFEEMRRLLEERDQQYQQELESYHEQMQPRQGPTCTCPATLCATHGAVGDVPCCQRCGQPVRSQVAGNCAGVRPFRESPQRPRRQPITAMEIPLMVPVRLELGVTNSYVNRTELRRLPYTESPPRLQMQPGCLPGCNVPQVPGCDVPRHAPPVPPSEVGYQTFDPAKISDTHIGENPGILSTSSSTTLDSVQRSVTATRRNSDDDI